MHERKQRHRPKLYWPMGDYTKEPVPVPPRWIEAVGFIIAGALFVLALVR